MARGRAFELDAFGSGLRGGRGPGRSTRGRGGTIPPSSSSTSGASSSSSGTSGASSSAQPPMPPSLPFVPSSSTPLSRPKHFVWEEAIAAMLKVAWEKLCVDQYADFTYRMRKSGKKQQRSETDGDGSGPSRHTGGSISAIETSRALKHFVWEEAIAAMLKVAWEKLCVDQYADFTYRMRKSGKKQQRSETDGDGSGPSRHTGGSISAIETSRALAKKHGREPTLMEVFTYTHTKGHDGNTFVDRRAVGVNSNACAARACFSGHALGVDISIVARTCAIARSGRAWLWKSNAFVARACQGLTLCLIFLDS
ncbi:hypothetical protein JCGZ_06835 [Jatropha curcas]|uniref:Uncharacterized protein n=1 Tax=Jatropha curcas TaxID=180498 RepID=A0A067KMB3_JATCU|nr:hypothetical protein JCGZ_06835 [Jatropha curcas]